MDAAEYIKKLKDATETPGKQVVNLIYGVDGNVCGNVQELLGLAHALRKEVDILLTERNLYRDIVKRWSKAVKIEREIGVFNDEAWGDIPCIETIKQMKT